MPPLPPPLDAQASELYGLPGVVLTLTLITIVLSFERYRRRRMSSEEGSVNKGSDDEESKDQKLHVSTDDKLPPAMYEAWLSQTPTTYELPSATAQTQQMSSGDMVKLLSLPPPSIRRHSYPSEDTQEDKDKDSEEPPQKKVAKTRIGSVTSFEGHEIGRKDMVLEREGWRRHAIVYGNNGPTERTSTW